MRIPPRQDGVTLKQLSVLPPKNPYEDVPTEPMHAIDVRPKMIKPLEKIITPRYNTLYDSLGSTQGWKYMADGLARGTITTTVNATVTVPVTLSAIPNWKLTQWPGAVQMYLAIRFFGIVPTALPTANAGMEVLFIDQFGNLAPLGELLSQAGGNSNYDTILPSPITDPGSTQVGTLSIGLVNVPSSSGTYLWSIGFSALYLLPARYGYEVLTEHEYADAQYELKKEKGHA